MRTSVLRMLVSELNYKQIDVQRDLTDEDVLVVIAKEVKKRKEAIESYTAAGRAESAAKEKQELEILQVYLPTLMTEAEVRAEIAKMEQLKGMTDFGQAMKIVSPMFKGRAEGGIVAKIVKETLGQ